MPLPFTDAEMGEDDELDATTPAVFTHIVPLNDLEEHELTPDCPCQPAFDRGENIFVHNSFDGRERTKH
jgi:hypothetical protein